MRTRRIQPPRLTVTLLVLAGCIFFLTSRSDALLVSNGRIAFDSDRTGSSEIFSMNPDGTDQVNLSNNSAADRNASWSPDGRKIAFSSEPRKTLQIVFADKQPGEAIMAGVEL
jgi:hypothetical protein